MNQARSISNEILDKAIQNGASDIHFFPNNEQTFIYFRVNGERDLYKSIPNSQYELILSYYKFTSRMDIGEVWKPQNGAIKVKKATGIFALRLSTLPVNHMESLAIRILPQDNYLSLEDLFLFPIQAKALKSYASKTAGLLLITGPTGSGKTTTLYSLLETIMKEKNSQAITLEDPIEKEIDHILQVQVNEKAGITYQTGLKAALRHDPDIIMVGEIRDKLTAEFAFEAALTGHLVLSTLHAKDTEGTIHRLLEMGLTKVEIEQTLIAVASVKLMPIIAHGKITKRAAIMELLNEKQLQYLLKGGENVQKNSFHSFDHLRRKAFAYGFISKESFNG